MFENRSIKLPYFVLTGLFFCLLLSCNGNNGPEPDLAPKTYTGDINLVTTEDLIQFQEDNINVIIGDLTIGSNSGTSDIADLSYLSVLEEVAGALTIVRTQLTTLQGLDSLRQTKSTSIRFNSTLENISALAKHDSRSLNIQGNAVLNSLAGLDSMRSSMEELYINSNPGLKSLRGLEFLESVFDLRIEGNQSLESLEGLGSLQEAEQFMLRSCHLIEDVSALTELIRLNGFSFIDNQRLASLKGLENITELEAFALIDNPQLQELEGLEGLRFYESMTIDNNQSLRNIDAIGNSVGSNIIRIQNNPQLQNVTGLGRTRDLWFLGLENNASLTSLTGLRSLTRLSYMALNGLAIEDLVGLESLLSAKAIQIKDNAKLLSFNGLNGLNSLEELHVETNERLEDININSDLVVSSDLILYQNPNLQFESFPIKTADELNRFAFHRSPLVNSLTGLEHLRAVNDLEIFELDGLQDLTGLDGLEEVRDVGLILENENLASLKGLEGLRLNNEAITVAKNAKLQDLCALRTLIESADFGGKLTVSENAFNPTPEQIQSGTCKD